MYLRCLVALILMTALGASAEIEHRWLVREDFPEFGAHTQNAIRVAVIGLYVKQQGFYYLPKGAAVQDAALAAKTNPSAVWERHYTGLQRLNADGTFQTIRFSQENRQIEEKIVLQDGDIFQISHECF